jgi:predicted nucleotidyltransferase
MTETVAGFELERLRGFVRAGPTPLFATLSGAHLYGFPSPDSDVDLRGAFVAPLADVIGLREPKETLTVSRIDDGLELDWVAHDVRKFAGLMTRRNGYVLEQLYSPLVVWGGPWLDELKALGAGCVVRQLHYHYRGFFNNQRKELAKPGATVKALLYAYRVALTGVHMLQTGRIEADLPTLVEAHQGALPAGLPERIADLIRRKRASDEKGKLGESELEEATASLEFFETALEDAHTASSLPEAVSTFDGLNDFVVRARLELGQ